MTLRPSAGPGVFREPHPFHGVERQLTELMQALGREFATDGDTQSINGLVDEARAKELANIELDVYLEVAKESLQALDPASES